MNEISRDLQVPKRPRNLFLFGEHLKDLSKFLHVVHDIFGVAPDSFTSNNVNFKATDNVVLICELTCNLIMSIILLIIDESRL